ncbi:alpha/beta fold hydrolase [Sphingobacterium pedocola]|nr:alpha/beta hydrolase [Sphingobacterium pedocola]
MNRQLYNKTINVDGVNIFYREAGDSRWGKYDVYFDVAEAHCYEKDLPEAETHILEGGHMALETNFDEVLDLIRNFLLSSVRYNYLSKNMKDRYETRFTS